MSLITKFVISVFAVLTLVNQSCGDGVGPLGHVGASGTQLNRKCPEDPHYYTSNSQIPSLPRFRGFGGSHGAYRFLSVIEQTAMMIGEPKHGLWRLQESGHVREYKKKGKVGLAAGVDPNAATLTKEQENVIENNYASYIPEEGPEAYRFPDKQIEDGKKGYLDLTIYNKKYHGKYDSHPPIDLPHFFCVITGPGYPHHHAWKFARAQPMANKVGPLGIRAGLDIRENYLNILRFHIMPDASLWANIGNMYANKYADIKSPNTAQTIDYRIVDLSKVDYEIYIYERTFYNQPYIMVTIVMENKNKNVPVFSYLRPDGAYWRGLQARGLGAGISSVENYFPNVTVEMGTNQLSVKPVVPLPLYGHHHPDRPAFNLVGGACPAKGGDTASYPWGNPGGGFASCYEEITPFCDGFALDIKIWANLWSESWTDPKLGLGNAGFGPDVTTVNFTVHANAYGIYKDPYLVSRGTKNPHKLILTADGKGIEEPNLDAKAHLKVDFATKGTLLEYTVVPDIVGISRDCTANPANTDATASVGTPAWAVATIAILLIAVVVLIAILAYRLKNPTAVSA